MHSTPGRRSRLSEIRVFQAPAIAVFLIVGTLATLWSLASPMMSVPDEPAHAIKAAAVVRGQLQGQPSGKQGEPAMVQVPGYFADLGQQLCYTFNPAKPATCSPQVDGTNRALAPALTSAGNYNPVYYALVGLPSRILDGAPALYAMRIVSGLISAFFLTVAFMAARRMTHSQWPVTGCIVALTPMVLFLCGSINPNSLEIVSTAAFFLNLCLVLGNVDDLRSMQWPLWAVGISAAVLANTRALSLLWLALAAAAAVIIFGWRPLVMALQTRLGAAMGALAGLGCAAGLAWLLLADSFKSLGGIPSAITPDQAFVTMLDRTFSYTEGYIGLMGWLDTPAPKGVQMLWHFAIAAMLFAGLSSRPVRHRWAIALLVAAIVILPPVLQAQVIHELGYIWQGRYLLAVITLLILACAVAMRQRSFVVSGTARTAARWMLGAAVAAHFYAFVYTFRRYTVGIMPEHTNWSEMWEASWQPPVTWQNLSVAYLVVLAAGAFLGYRALFPRAPFPGRHSGARLGSPGPVQVHQAAVASKVGSRFGTLLDARAKVEPNNNGSLMVGHEGDQRHAL